ncbi:MAG TPA: hypothetical protein DEB46_01530 [Myxococcales bacterium]|nr:hypothetical protein [Myxococcales bacterium]HBU46967.1 hypothetical protein [Myxococcales bacterium]
MSFSNIIKSMDQDFFQEVLSSCPRKPRETLFARFGIARNRKKVSTLLPGKDPARAAKLKSALGAVDVEDEQGQQLAEEVLRLYLLKRRQILAHAMDHLEVDHEEGLTEEDVDFAAMSEPDRQALRDALAVDHDPKDVDLYIAYMVASS